MHRARMVVLLLVCLLVLVGCAVGTGLVLGQALVKVVESVAEGED